MIGLNYLGTRYRKQWDLTEASVYTLSPQSKKVAEALTDKLVLTAFIEGGSNPQLQTILDGYRDAAPGRVETRMLDPDKEPALAEQMKITTVPSVHIQYGKESFVVTHSHRGDGHQRHHPGHASGQEGRLLHRGLRRAAADRTRRIPKGFASIKLAARAGELRGQDAPPAVGRDDP